MRKERENSVSEKFQETCDNKAIHHGTQGPLQSSPAATPPSRWREMPGILWSWEQRNATPEHDQGNVGMGQRMGIQTDKRRGTERDTAR